MGTRKNNVPYNSTAGETQMAFGEFKNLKQVLQLFYNLPFNMGIRMFQVTVTDLVHF